MAEIFPSDVFFIVSIFYTGHIQKEGEMELLLTIQGSVVEWQPHAPRGPACRTGRDHGEWNFSLLKKCLIYHGIGEFWLSSVQMSESLVVYWLCFGCRGESILIDWREPTSPPNHDWVTRRHDMTWTKDREYHPQTSPCKQKQLNLGWFLLYNIQ